MWYRPDSEKAPSKDEQPGPPLQGRGGSGGERWEERVDMARSLSMNSTVDFPRRKRRAGYSASRITYLNQITRSSVAGLDRLSMYLQSTKGCDAAARGGVGWGWVVGGGGRKNAHALREEGGGGGDLAGKDDVY